MTNELDIEWFFKHLERDFEINELNTRLIQADMLKERQIKNAQERNFPRRMILADF
ncbi:MAG: hypothetical protein JXA43_00780 [Candidatus Diapherotrites archaeon]|nr:hypothetical protein [Candidatus Diapherotrites archaeon]